uniref:TGF-beta-activated kinase 1 and MAP3K7-binding protein 2-like n=1 Tax=Phallusia mammillata TaxID=59560 RepID=A0A6F9DUS0_9ASCI|nr:TGF-beta-activated kinase 1 and MAP3K7-binding protein 2-like [Phallusia mammillata]
MSSSKFDPEDFHGDLVDDVTHGKQWEAINDHLREMSWTNVATPLSTSPGNPGGHAPPPCLQRIHTTHNPQYRRSEGDLQGKTLNAKQAIQPPQSAPILPEDYEPKWANPTPVLYSAPGGSKITPVPPKIQKSPVNKILVNGQQPLASHAMGIGSSPTGYMNLGDLPIDNLPPMPSNFFPDHVTSQRGSTSGHSSGSSSPMVVRQVSSPTLANFPSTHAPLVYNLPNEISKGPPVIQHSMSAYSLRPMPGPSKPSEINVYGSPSPRRRSMPTKQEEMYGPKSNVTRRAISQQATSQHLGSIPPFTTQDIFVGTALSENVEELDGETGKNDDKEYTIALLQHQEDRMNRLQTELEAKKRELSSLMSEMQDLEAKMMDRSARSSSTLQLDVGRLREINRQLEIDCNCMHKEVELFFRDGDNTRDNFYSRYNHRASVKPTGKRKPVGPKNPEYTDLPPPPVPPPQETDDEPKWRCTYCTFDNHAALNKCEMCEYSRDVQSSRVRL